MVRKLELLAPAKDKACAFKAIDYGADAVYIGANAYGARKNASNSIENIEEIINYAHLFNVKVYVTINTILNDEEVLEAKKLIEKLYNVGVDGIIIQDMGLLELDLPPIKLFASTQCDNRSIEKIKFFEETGVSRVILARELSLKQIKEISDNTEIDLEAFISGALCVSYSGQCYLSYASGGRSANRGECAQACRKKYTLSDASGKILIKDKHLLSLKDFSAAKHIDGLVKAGITSFKIEGRLKDVNYIKNTVGYYRKILDKYPKSSSGSIFFDFEPDCQKSFNRGFCDYFLTAQKNPSLENNIYNFDTPKAIGQYIGTIKDVGKNYFIVNTKEKISPQDGLCYIANGGFTGCLVNKVEVISPILCKIFPHKIAMIKNGVEIYRNNDVVFENILKKSKTKRRLAINFKIYKDYIEAIDENETRVKVLFEKVEIAQNKGKMIENYKTSLNKNSESNFWTKSVQIMTDEVNFVPVSILNQIRRDIYEQISALRLKNYKRKIQKKIHPAPFYKDKGDYKQNIHNKYAKEFMEKCGCKIIEGSLESGTSVKNKELMRCKFCLKNAVNMCKNSTELTLTDEKGKSFKLEFDCKNCEMVIKNK